MRSRMAKHMASTSRSGTSGHRQPQNKKFKVLVGAPASQDAAGSGYVDSDQLRANVKYSQKFKSLKNVVI